MKLIVSASLVVLVFVLNAPASTFAGQAQEKSATAKQTTEQARQQPREPTEAQKDMRNLSMRMTFFYRKPTADEFKEINRLIGKHEDLILKVSKRNRFNVISATFLARVHEKHKFPITCEGTIGKLAKAIIAGDKKDKDAVFVNDPKLITASKLDAWWVSFSATGDTKYVESILQQTGNPKTKKVNGMFDIPVVAAANWSFKSNCRTHKPVLQFAIEAAKKEKWAKEKAFLEYCIKAAKTPAKKASPAA